MFLNSFPGILRSSRSRKASLHFSSGTCRCQCFSVMSCDWFVVAM